MNEPTNPAPAPALDAAALAEIAIRSTARGQVSALDFNAVMDSHRRLIAEVARLHLCAKCRKKTTEELEAGFSTQGAPDAR